MVAYKLRYISIEYCLCYAFNFFCFWVSILFSSSLLVFRKHSESKERFKSGLLGLNSPTPLYFPSFNSLLLLPCKPSNLYNSDWLVQTICWEPVDPLIFICRDTHILHVCLVSSKVLHRKGVSLDFIWRVQILQHFKEDLGPSVLQQWWK